MSWCWHRRSRRPRGPIPAFATVIRALLILTTMFVAVSASARSTPCTSSKTCRDVLALSTGGSIPYYRSLPLIHNNLVVRAVLIVHGNQRDADRYYDRAVAAATAANEMRGLVLLAPNFLTRKEHPAANQHYWSSGGWKIGNKSRDPARVSSFAVMNELLARVCPKEPAIFPNLKVVVVIGHSAGAQFVNRYAAGGAGCPDHQVEVRYVVMNPSSYLYADGRRKSETTGARCTSACLLDLFHFSCSLRPLTVEVFS